MAATLSRMMRRASASSSVILTISNKSTPSRNYTTSILSNPLKTSSTIISTSSSNTKEVSPAASIPTHRDFSSLTEKRSNSDDTLLSFIASGINCADEKFNEVAKALPREFPFKIEDNGGEEGPTLTYEYQGEEIKVRVHENYHQKGVCLVGNISNKSGLTLGFNVTADVAGGIRIEDLVLRNADDGDDTFGRNKPSFSEMDENLQKAFYTYLEVRGIEPKISKFLCDYMGQRKHKRYSMWLKDLENFIAN